MSELRRSLAAEAKSGPEVHRPTNVGWSAFAGLRRRWPLYMGLAVVAVLALAWFDGGYEPIHPITQSVEVTPATKGTN